jgi:hypothetical protein
MAKLLAHHYWSLLSRIQHTSLEMALSCFGRFLPEKWQDEFIAHVVEYSPGTEYCEEDGQTIDLQNDDVSVVRAYLQFHVTCDECRHAFKSIELSMIFNETLPDDYSMEKYEETPYYHEIKAHAGSAVDEMLHFVWEYAFKVGQHGIRAIFTTENGKRAVIQFDYHFALLEISTCSYIRIPINYQDAALNVDLVSFLHGRSAMEAFLRTFPFYEQIEWNVMGSSRVISGNQLAQHLTMKSVYHAQPPPV